MRALVTGSEGFVGRILCEHLAARGWEVRGCDVSIRMEEMHSRRCDMTELSEVESVVKWAGDVTHVFHLAGITFVPQTVEWPTLAMNVNCNGTINLAHSIRRRCPRARLIMVSTAEVYGPPQRLPIDESHPINPINPYSISKAAADLYCRFLSERGELDIVRARPFNHTGAGQGDQFVLSSFARQIAEIEVGRAEPVLRVGNIENARDFSHVRDVVRAYELLALKGRAGEAYNISSGKSRIIKDAMERMLKLSDKSISVEIDPRRYRPETVPDVHGSHAKLTADTGWEPEIGFESLIEELLGDWRARMTRVEQEGKSEALGS